MQIDLKDDQALKSVISEALLRAVDANTRETLIGAAIEKLLAPEESGGNYYGAPKRWAWRAFKRCSTCCRATWTFPRARRRR